MRVFASYLLLMCLILQIKPQSIFKFDEFSDKLDNKFCIKLMIDFVRSMINNANNELDCFKNTIEQNPLVNKHDKDLGKILDDLFNSKNEFNIDYYSFVFDIHRLNESLALNNHLRALLKKHDKKIDIPCGNLTDFFNSYTYFDKDQYRFKKNVLADLKIKINEHCNNFKTATNNSERRQLIFMECIDLTNFYSNLLKLIIIKRIDNDRIPTELKIDEKELKDAYLIMFNRGFDNKNTDTVGYEFKYDADYSMNMILEAFQTEDYNNRIECQFISSKFNIIRLFLNEYYSKKENSELFMEQKHNNCIVNMKEISLSETHLINDSFLKKEFLAFINELEKILIYRYNSIKGATEPKNNLYSKLLSNLYFGNVEIAKRISLQNFKEVVFFNNLMNTCFKEIATLFITNNSFKEDDIAYFLLILTNINLSKYKWYTFQKLGTEFNCNLKCNGYLDE